MSDHTELKITWLHSFPQSSPPAPCIVPPGRDHHIPCHFSDEKSHPKSPGLPLKKSISARMAFCILPDHIQAGRSALPLVRHQWLPLIRLHPLFPSVFSEFRTAFGLLLQSGNSIPMAGLEDPHISTFHIFHHRTPVMQVPPDVPHTS